MARKSRLLTLPNPFYVKPVRLDRSGRTTFKEAVRAYLDTTKVALLRAGTGPSDKFHATSEAMKDFAGQMDRQAVVVLKKKVRK